jgi:hypothetical protein
MVNHIANATRIMLDNYVRLKFVNQVALQMEVHVTLIMENVRTAQQSVTEKHANIYIAGGTEAITLPTCVTIMENATKLLVYVLVS